MSIEKENKEQNMFFFDAPWSFALYLNLCKNTKTSVFHYYNVTSGGGGACVSVVALVLWQGAR